MTTRNSTAKPGPEPFERQVERLERLARFGTELAAALRGEFGYYWVHPDRCGQVPQATPFIRRVEELKLLAARYQRELQGLQVMPPIQALTTFRALDGAKLFTAVQGLEATAKVLRDAGRERGWGSHTVERAAPMASRARALAEPAATARPTAPKPAPMAITGRLKAWLGAIEAAALPAPPQPPPPPSVGARRLTAFSSSLALVIAVATELVGPMGALRAAYTGAEAPPGLTPALAAAIPPAAAEIAAHQGLRRSALIALTQHAQFIGQLPAFEQALEEAREAPEETVGEVLKAHDLGKLKGTMFPLTTLHLTFRDYPATAALFPSPDVVRVKATVPRVERPAPRPAPEAQAPEPPPVEAAEPIPAEPGAGASSPPAIGDWRQDADVRSRKRLALLMAYMRNPADRTVFKDEATVYRFISEEILYQQDRERDRQMQLRIFLAKPLEGPAGQKRQAALQKELTEARTLLTQLAQVQKFATGRAVPPKPPPPQ